MMVVPTKPDNRRYPPSEGHDDAMRPLPMSDTVPKAGALKACPFCDAPGEMIRPLGERLYNRDEIGRHKPPFFGPNWFRVICTGDECHCSSRAFDNAEQAIAAWNRRAIEPAPAADSEVTEAMVEAACKAHAPQWDGIDDEIKIYARQQMRAALLAARSPRPDAKEGDGAATTGTEPVAWRWRETHDDRWMVLPIPPGSQGEGCIVEPLYAHPPVAETPSEEMVEIGAQAAFKAGWPHENERNQQLQRNPSTLDGYRKIIRAALTAVFARSLPLNPPGTKQEEGA